MISLRCAGQNNSPLQRATASPSMCSTCEPQERVLRNPEGGAETVEKEEQAVAKLEAAVKEMMGYLQTLDADKAREVSANAHAIKRKIDELIEDMRSPDLTRQEKGERYKKCLSFVDEKFDEMTPKLQKTRTNWSTIAKNILFVLTGFGAISLGIHLAATKIHEGHARFFFEKKTTSESLANKVEKDIHNMGKRFNDTDYEPKTTKRRKI